MCYFVRCRSVEQPTLPQLNFKDIRNMQTVVIPVVDIVCGRLIPCISL